VDLSAAFLGQTHDLNGSVSRHQIDDLVNSECAHVAYQALSRGRCRNIENGMAKPMNAWVIHRDAGIRSYLDKVMPGVTWTSWKKKTATKVNAGITGDTVTRIVNFLVDLPAERLKVSSKELKKTTGLTEVAKKTFYDALLKAIEVATEWVIDGRSLVRKPSPT